MPIKPENKSKYPANWKSEIRPRILARANNRCEWCGVSNYTIGYRRANGVFVPTMGDLSNASVDHRGRLYVEGMRVIRIVLTIAHIGNEDPSDCRDENLAALCQRCHLTHDVRRRMRVKAEQAAIIAAAMAIEQDRKQGQNHLFNLEVA